MPRPIDANALKERILKERDKIPLTTPAAPYELVPRKVNQHGNAMRGGIRVALRCMEETPTIDAEPVRHGRWEHGMRCSGCGQVDTTKPNYCPNCGTKMDGGVER